jgi:hypothetical protein
MLMNASIKVASALLRIKPLAACFTTIFALAAPDAMATTWPVTTCADSGPGSLRSVVGDPTVVSNDTVDMSNLSCSVISLTTGAITINQHNLTLQGPASGKMRIVTPVNPQVHDSILNHQGTGTLIISDLYLAFGYGHLVNANSRYGGCIFSAGNVLVSRSDVTECGAGPITASGGAAGGGIYARGNLFLANSRIHDNGVGNGSNGTFAAGGGVVVGGVLTAKYSTISGNRAVGNGNVSAGGVYALGNVSISGSTISNNSSDGISGGLAILAVASGHSATITNSTISGNTAKAAAGMYSGVATLIRSSTIAFNRNTSHPGYSPGLTFNAASESITVNLQSSLIANNTYVAYGATFDNDIAIAPSNSYTVTLTGANNLVRNASAAVKAQLPLDTITGACPLLGPLRDNGGSTQTHALLSGSPGIDQGNNSALLSYDQRSGPTPPPIVQPPLGYPRVSGGGADIGAYELQLSDIVFSSDFDGCP